MAAGLLTLPGCPKKDAVVDRPPLDPGGARWATAITATGPVVVHAVGFAGDDVIAAGEFDGTLAIAAVRARSAGGRDGFVARLDPRGAPRWVKTFGGPGADRVIAVAVGADGVIAIGGEYEPGLEIGGAPLGAGGRPDGLVASLSASGEVRWARGIGASRYASIASVAQTPDGEVVAAGQLAGSAERDAEIHAAGNQDVLVVRYDSGGKERWLRRAGGPGSDFAAAVVAGPGGEIAIAGSIMDGARFGATELETIGEQPDAFVARVDQSGAPIWVRQLGGAGADSAAALALSEGALVCAGQFSRDLGGVGSKLSSTGSTDGFVAWLSLGGQPMRAAGIGGEGADWLAAVAGGDGVVIGGGFVGRAGGDLQSAGELDGLVGKLAGTQPRWRRPIGGQGNDVIEAVAVGPGGAVAVGGSFSKDLRLDDHRLDAGDLRAGFVAVLEP